ncbi:MAG: ribosome silencing factor [Abitibacteriaceae bacterium]|nr:ribosome silencing factor [Abditibacteriaceae bacterium]
MTTQTAVTTTPHILAADDSEGRMQMICTAADEYKARNIVVLDMRGQTIVADFFIICSGTSTTHIQSIADGIQDRLRERARLRAKSEGDSRSFWIILDYSDVIVHIFDEETREFYDLERLWADAKVIPWSAEHEAEATAGSGNSFEHQSE